MLSHGSIRTPGRWRNNDAGLCEMPQPHRRSCANGNGFSTDFHGRAPRRAARDHRYTVGFLVFVIIMLVIVLIGSIRG
jgi:hypothetical protein